MFHGYFIISLWKLNVVYNHLVAKFNFLMEYHLLFCHACKESKK